MSSPPSNDLLESSHQFPGIYQIKAIGLADDQFETRVLDAIRAELQADSDVDYTVRSTPGGRHVSLTLDLSVQSADHVRAIYRRIHEVPGLMLLL
jgi:putative lipoic acid-binding regulatory protein